MSKRKIEHQDCELSGDKDEESLGHQEDSDRSKLKLTTSPYRQAKTLRAIRRKHKQDMYKVMDGSALMALGKLFFSIPFLWIDSHVAAGMLVQEHVARLVQGQAPEGRQEEIMTKCLGL